MAGSCWKQCYGLKAPQARLDIDILSKTSPNTKIYSNFSKPLVLTPPVDLQNRAKGTQNSWNSTDTWESIDTFDLIFTERLFTINRVRLDKTIKTFPKGISSLDVAKIACFLCDTYTSIGRCKMVLCSIFRN